jgi:hypothetical protein
MEDGSRNAAEYQGLYGAQASRADDDQIYVAHPRERENRFDGVALDDLVVDRRRCSGLRRASRQ